MANIGRPTTALEVLRNFKLALDNDLFLRDDFYTDENLGKFFAANQVSWIEATPARTFGNVYSQYAAFFLIRGTIDDKGDVVANGKKRGGGAINVAITAEAIIELFGQPMKISNPYAADTAGHSTPLSKNTHKLGNLAIEYKFDRPNSTASVNCRFNGDGTLDSCGFESREK